MAKSNLEPIIFYEGQYTFSELEQFKESVHIFQSRDIYEYQLTELFEINHPELMNSREYFQQLNTYLAEKTIDWEERGNWVYFPWSGLLVHMISEECYNKIRFNRNQHLITQEEQTLLKDFSIGLTGLSVGSNIALGLAYQGISNIMKLADFDTVATSNLNRTRFGLSHVGRPKIEMIAEKLYNINPYLNLRLFKYGLVEECISTFFDKDPCINLIFDEIDDLYMKVRLRIEARKRGIPVIMLTSLADVVLVDIERYDLNPSLDLFNGELGDVPEELLKKPLLSEAERNQYALKIVGLNNVTPRIIKSLKDIGKTLIGRPQLSTTVTTAGEIGTYLCRKIALGQPVPSGRCRVQLSDAIIKEDSGQKTNLQFAFANASSSQSS